MVWEGLLQEGLAITRAVHDRYHASRRNPYNEVECGDHYARSMASYGVFLAACGFENHGPKGHIGFAPRMTPDDFRTPFTTAGAWGTYVQKREGNTLTATIAVKFGQTRLKTVALAAGASKATVTHDGKPVAARVDVKDGRALVTLDKDVTLSAGSALVVQLT
jgi:hypothetical protein